MLLHSRRAAHQASSVQAVINSAQEVDSKSLKQTVVVATLDCPLAEHKNAIWCSTFQMAWDKFKGDIIGEPIRLIGSEDLATRLNQATFPTRDVEPQSYYVNAGFVESGIIEQIQRGMASRFPSEPAPHFDDGYRTLPKVALAYAYLSVDVGFTHAYYVDSTPFLFAASDGQISRVSSFCSYAFGADNTMVREQVDILHYRDGDTVDSTEFAVDLCTHTKPYQVILARVPRCGTLGEIHRVVQERIAKFKEDPDYATLSKLRPIDKLVAPDVLYKLTHHFDELLGKDLANPKWPETYVFDAMQKIDFTLSRTGVILKSEARMATATRGASLPRQLLKPRLLRFDKPFLICVKKREANATPFFLMWVDNAELMQAATSRQ